MSIKKFRPYFTLTELKHLHSLSLADNQLSPMTRYLGRYILEIDSGYRSENYTTNPIPSIEDKLGFSSVTISAAGKTAYEKDQENRFLNNEMTEEEESIYLSSMGVPTSGAQK